MPQLIDTQKVWLNGFDISGDHRTLAVSREVAELDATTLGSGGTQVNEPGLKGYGFAGEGLWEGGANNIDDILHGKISVRRIPFTVGLQSGAEGERAESALVMQGSLEFGAAVGELLPVNYGLSAMDTPVSGTILHAGSATGNVTGTSFNVGQVAAGQKLYGILHVFSGSGDFTVRIRSAGNEAFTTSPTDRITFTQVGTAVPRASEWATPVDGAITQAWWRIEATNPATRNFAVIMAIQ